MTNAVEVLGEQVQDMTGDVAVTVATIVVALLLVVGILWAYKQVRMWI